MDMLDTYTQIVRLIDDLSDEELNALASYVREMIGARQHMANYDPEKDPVVTGEGLLDGPPDLSARVSAFLHPEDQEAVDE